MKNIKLKILNFIILILGSISYSIGKIWAIVSFIIYLVNGIPFNWGSIILLIIGLILIIISYMSLFLNIKK